MRRVCQLPIVWAGTDDYILYSTWSIQKIYQM